MMACHLGLFQQEYLAIQYANMKAFWHYQTLGLQSPPKNPVTEELSLILLDTQLHTCAILVKGTHLQERSSASYVPNIWSYRTKNWTKNQPWELNPNPEIALTGAKDYFIPQLILMRAVIIGL